MTGGRAQDALTAALARRQADATEPNLVDAATALEPIPLAEVLRVLDQLGSASGDVVLSNLRTAACRRAAAILRDRVDESEVDRLLSSPPRARLTDPQTSKDAAREVRVTATNQAGRLLLAYASHDKHKDWRDGCVYSEGMTSEEAADEAPQVSLRSEFAKRCSDLTTLGLLEPVEGRRVLADPASPQLDATRTEPYPLTRPGRSGRQRQVLRITDAGRALARQLTSGA